MDRPPAPLQVSGRLIGGPPYGRAGAPVSFDPSAAVPGPLTTAKAPHAKDYGSCFSEGFLQFLKSGELADVVVDVVADDTTVIAATSSCPTSCSTPVLAASTSLPPPASALPTAFPTSLSSSLSSLASSPFLASAATCGNATTAAAPAPALAASSSSSVSSPIYGLGEYRLHGLLLARHSAFFAAAFGQDHFADSAARRIRVTLDAAATPAWPALVEYFYTDRVRLDDSNALPLLALARQLLVSELDSYCMDYVYGRLCVANCLVYMRAAVRFAFHDLHAECVALAAQGFPLLYGSDLSGLPPGSLLEILTHPELQVHCELQVVEAVTRYLATTAVSTESQRALCSQIRFPYLDNATITRLAVQPGLVLAAMTGGQQPSQDVSTAAGTTTVATTAAAVADAPPTRSEHSVGIGDFEASSGPDAPTPIISMSMPTPTPPADAETGPGNRRGLDASESMPMAAADAVGRRSSDGAAAGSSSSAVAVEGDIAAGEGTAAEDEVYGDGGSGPLAPHAAATDGDSGGLLSASSSAASSPRSSSSGGGDAAAAAEGHSLPYNTSRSDPSSYNCRHEQDLRRQQQRCGADGQAVAPPAAVQQQEEQQQHHHHHHHHHHQQQPLLPRDLTLEGAMARLAAMEYHNSLPQIQNQFQYYPYGSGTTAGGTPATAAITSVAAATGSGRRPLAVFRMSGDPQQPTAAPPGGSGRPHPHALAHGLYYSHPAGGGGGGGAQMPHHPAHVAASRGATSARGPGNGIGGVANQLAPGSGGGGGGGGGGAAAGGVTLDAAAAFAAFCLPPPRASYCCNVVHGLPGGCAWVDVALEVLWERLVPYIHVQVSGCVEGNPRNVITSDPDCFFETNDSSDPLPWVEVHLPHNVHVLQLHRYTFLHGHRRAGYYRARNFKTQIAVRTANDIRSPAARSSSAGGGGGAGVGAAGAANPAAAGAAGGGQRPGQVQVFFHGSGAAGPHVGAPLPPASRYVDLTTRMADQFEVGVLAGAASPPGPWRVMRLQATGPQEDGVHRLCVRGLKQQQQLPAAAAAGPGLLAAAALQGTDTALAAALPATAAAAAAASFTLGWPGTKHTEVLFRGI
ncbi:hypothetical protein VOLCADRAFT_90371 [Volvox carteri f. nagariensis]|uniref:BTB domain-containing protein n=1 Tax=Volvox carteri f. nagariensis TaxID=3068 RepID=D8TU71_VOLCA|nr:uncharacterized protein VOLCADRAFT_90371 [Volvox carteri f. nagariensis]EFJ48985.1 hypothetical protein VOLCADRAFT_90371 [Volvox carteri f. nagariensis]|eukprot:XP_002949882.1 hypothetical protein VOLCADRAFT_90371 [Volvox carteri f. nagariensis]